MNAAPLTALAFGFVSLIVSTELSLVPIDAGANDFTAASAGSGAATVSVASEAVPLPAFVVVTTPLLLI